MVRRLALLPLLIAAACSDAGDTGTPPLKDTDDPTTGTTGFTTGTTDTGDTGDTGTTTGSGTGTATGTSVPTHDIDIQPIWNAKCGPGCHTSGAVSGTLNLDNAYNKIVNRPSGQAPVLDFVEPGQLDDSYLWHKLQGTQLTVGGSGVKMPKTGTLSQGQRDLIEAWIAGGAPR